jgi:hypothetical protein
MHLKDARCSQMLAITGGFPCQSPLARTGGEMTKKFDRLITISELSEMFGVPVDTLYGWGTAARPGRLQNRSSR